MKREIELKFKCAFKTTFTSEVTSKEYIYIRPYDSHIKAVNVLVRERKKMGWVRESFWFKISDEKLKTKTP